MNYAFQTQSAITKLLVFNIEYSKIHESYLFNGKWAEEYDESFYIDKIEEIKNLLHIALKNGLNQEKYLQDLLNQIGKRFEWLIAYKHNTPNFLDFYSEKIIQTDLPYEKLSNNIIAYEKFKKGGLELTNYNSDLFNYLSFISKKMNQYKSLLDFEKGLLLYAINLYKEAISELYYYIDSINMYASHIDFKNYNLDDLTLTTGITHNRKICHFNLDKKSIAYIFRILLEEKLILFNETDEYKNEFELKKFVEEYFTYLGEEKERKPIKTFNREYSEMRSLEKDFVQKQIKVAEMICNIFETRKINLINILQKNN